MQSSSAEIEARSIRLALPNAPDAVERARLAVTALLADTEIAHVVRYRIELVIEEVLMNQVLHAFPEGGTHTIVFTAEREPQRIALTFEDDGVAFDPSLRAPKKPATSLADAVPGGYGISLLRKAATAMHYARENGLNRLTVGIALA